MVRPCNLAGYSSNFSTTLIMCSYISFPMDVEERPAMSKNQSKPTVTALMNMTSRAASLMSVLSSKVRLKAAHNFSLSLKVYSVLSERSFVLREAAKRERLARSTKCFFSGHAYSVNIVKQLLMNSLSPKGFAFSAIVSHNLKLSLESFL